MSPREYKQNLIHRPRLPIRKPDRTGRGDNVVVDFMSKGARDEESFVILTSEPDLFHVMIDWLNDKQLKFVEVQGGYRLRDGSDRFVVEEAILATRDVAVKIWQQGWIDTQESVLHLYHKDVLGRYKAELVFLNDIDKDNVDLGLLVQTTREKALSNLDGYTYKPESDSYYVVI